MATPKQQALDIIEAIQVDAMDEVLAWVNADEKEPVRGISWEYFLRRIYRWYGEKFSVDPYHAMATIPFDFVLQAYYETRYEAMEDPERIEEATILAETEEQRAVRRAAEKKAEAEDEEFLKMVEAENVQKTVKKALRSGQEIADQLVTMGDMISKAMLPLAKLSEQGEFEEEPPDIKIEMVSDEEIQRLEKEIEEREWSLFGGDKG